LPRTLHLAATLCAALLSVGTARADLVTPGSVSPTPTDWVTDQYKQLGLVFAAPSPMWGIGVGTYYDGGWTSYTAYWQIGPNGLPSGVPQPGVPAGLVSLSFVMPGSGASATTDSVRVRLYSTSDADITLQGYNTTGNLVGSRDVFVTSTSDGWLTLHAPGLHQLDIVSNWPPGPGLKFNSPHYDVEAIEFHPLATLPEPGGLALFGLGALSLASGAWRRRS
jgi:hypothetical protein